MTIDSMRLPACVHSPDLEAVFALIRRLVGDRHHIPGALEINRKKIRKIIRLGTKQPVDKPSVAA
ncbi:hypothetical protein [Caballeronia hypogeia]|uniref:hypothetical protein n=1 Tax=Caballeronia hypogeia TaxID=1777140 RepID=UPI0012FD5ADC|nr:hypothetical protein [Caballeronia hypogeia]